MDAENHLTVEADVPAGAKFAALEAGLDGRTWNTWLAVNLDGRTSRVTFRLPRPPGSRSGMARVRTGAGAAPPAEISGDTLVNVLYEPGVVPEEARIDLLNAAGAKMREWRDLSVEQYTANLIAWAKSSALVADAVVSDLSGSAVFVQFRDGVVCTLYQRRRVEDPVPGLVAQAQRAPAVRVMGAAGGGESSEPVTGVPGSTNAICAYSLEAHIFPNSAPTIAGWLGGAGYQTQTFSSTTIDDILAWSAARPIGVLFWQAHGTPYAIDGKLGGPEGICLVTRQPATATRILGKYASMMRRGEMGLAKDDSETQPSYTITSKFVRTYMRFAPHSLVVLDACFAAHHELSNAFVETGAGAVGAWDIAGGKESTTPILKVFDRLLGTNQEPPISFPKERPFSLPVIQMWMLMRGYDVDPSPKYPGQTDFNARLIWNTNSTHPAYILRPSIMRVLYEGADIGENFTKLLIEGNYGTDPGPAKRQLLWAGQPVNILCWQQDGITIRAPDNMPSGGFQAIINGVHVSNERPFTEWTVPFTYEHHGRGSLGYTIEMNVKMRADIAGTRGMPEMPPQYLPVNFWHLTDCTGKLTAGGSYSPDPYTTISWSGMAQLRSYDPQVPGNEFRLDSILNNGQLNPVTGRIDGYRVQALGRFTETTTDQPPREVIGGTPLTLYLQITPAINLGNYAFVGDSRTVVDPGGGGSESVSWPTVTPKAAPAPDTLR